jgi:lipoic acid synthetase
VTRDDLPDGGAAHFAATVRAIRDKSPGTRVEVLIPDLQGDEAALGVILEAAPEVLNHNLETTKPMYPAIGRPRGNYGRSLAVLAAAKRRGAVTKSGLMIGLGEEEEDLLRAFTDLRRAGCDLLTIGQYLRPRAANPPVARYYTPAEFASLGAAARRAGFTRVLSGPLVRSSFEAESLYRAVQQKEGSPCGI